MASERQRGRLPPFFHDELASLPLDERGLYASVIAFVELTGRSVPADDVVASRKLGVDVRQYRRVLNALLQRGKLSRRGDGSIGPPAI